MVNALVFLVVLAIFPAARSQFACPQQNIANYPYVIPVGATSMNLIPQNYNCTYTFISIPPGSAVKVTLNMNLGQTDHVYFVDSLDNSVQLPSPLVTQDYIRYIIGRTAKFIIDAPSGSSRLYAKIELVAFAKNYPPISYTCGDYAPLQRATNNSLVFKNYRMGGSLMVTATLISSADTDTALNNVFVFDGDNLNAPCLGNLGAGSIGSTGDTITLVNLYGTNTANYVVSNDLEAMQAYSSYKAILIPGSSSVSANLASMSAKPAAYTFLAPAQTQIFVSQLRFITQTSSSYVGFVPLSYKFDQTLMLKYTASMPLSNMFPQQIPSNIATLVLSTGSISTTVYSTMPNYGDARDGREGYFISPAFWSGLPGPSALTLADTKNTYDYSVTVEELRLQFPGPEKLQIQVTDNSQKSTLSKDYTTKIVNGNQELVGRGNTLQIDMVMNQTAIGSGTRVHFKSTLYSSSYSIGLGLAWLIGLLHLMIAKSI